LITYAMIALLATAAISSAATNKDAMREKEKAAWQAFRVAGGGPYDQKDQSGTYNAGSGWKKQNGEWQAIFHTNQKRYQPEDKFSLAVGWWPAPSPLASLGGDISPREARIMAL
jgi:hypothetical protein